MAAIYIKFIGACIAISILCISLGLTYENPTFVIFCAILVLILKPFDSFRLLLEAEKKFSIILQMTVVAAYYIYYQVY